MPSPSTSSSSSSPSVNAAEVVDQTTYIIKKLIFFNAHHKHTYESIALLSTMGFGVFGKKNLNNWEIKQIQWLELHLFVLDLLNNFF